MKKLILGTFGNQATPFCIYSFENKENNNRTKVTEKTENDTLFYCLEEINTVFLNGQLPQSFLTANLSRKIEDDDNHLPTHKEGKTFTSITAQLQRKYLDWNMKDFMKNKETGAIFIKPSSLLPIARFYNAYCLAELCKLTLNEIQAFVAAPLFKVIQCPNWHYRHYEELPCHFSLESLSADEVDFYVVDQRAQQSSINFNITTNSAADMASSVAANNHYHARPKTSTSAKQSPPLTYSTSSICKWFTCNTDIDTSLKHKMNNIFIIKLQQQAIIETRLRKTAFENRIPLEDSITTMRSYTVNTSIINDDSFRNYKRRSRQKKLANTDNITIHTEISSVSNSTLAPFSTSTIAGQFEQPNTTTKILAVQNSSNINTKEQSNRSPQPSLSASPPITLVNTCSSSNTYNAVGIKRKQSTFTSASTLVAPVLQEPKENTLAVAFSSDDSACNGTNNSNKRRKKDLYSSTVDPYHVLPAVVEKERGIDNLYLLATQAAQLIPLPLSPEGSPPLSSPTFYERSPTNVQVPSCLPSIQTIFPDLKNQQQSPIEHYCLPHSTDNLQSQYTQQQQQQQQGKGTSLVVSPVSHSYCHL
ncbi:hypothetical protein BDF20DRAFT_909140 [Mycotypha africana]|uniref:uncharacterized protein n=1 Tax=Mycotypha africana TaxID=64632 RepID=UPI002301D8F9|nr:uncharacterized protein BDF20DRAFT_909140 [Mycotypha africana]KAI8991349.1 hypothetical protein BDF20DRAFT_909140 [Mycotypha africana]